MNRPAPARPQSTNSSVKIGIVGFLATCAILSLSYRMHPDAAFQPSMVAAIAATPTMS